MPRGRTRGPRPKLRWKTASFRMLDSQWEWLSERAEREMRTRSGMLRILFTELMEAEMADEAQNTSQA